MTLEKVRATPFVLSIDMSKIQRRFGIERWSCVLIIAGVFAFAGIGKLIDPLAMKPVLQLLLPEGLASGRWPVLIASSIGALELMIALGAVVFARSSIIWWGVVLLLVAYTGVLTGLVAIPNAPSCGCLGFLFGGPEQTMLAIGRNVGLLVCALFLTAQGAIPNGVVESRRRRPALTGGASTGFTLIETLVTIVVIGALIAITLPSLRGARESAQLTNNSSFLRQIAGGIHEYTTDYQDMFPNIGVSGRPWETLRVDGEKVETSYFLGNPVYFMQSRYYANILSPDYIGPRAPLDWPEEFGERSRNDRHFITPYQVTATAFAPPRYWMGDEVPEDLSLYRGARVSDCVFPASKGLVVHLLSGGFVPSRFASASDQYFAAAVDGSAGPHRFPSDDELDQNMVSRPYGAPPVPIMSTRDGMAGRDF